MRELNAKPDGYKYVPKLHDVFVHEYIEKSQGKQRLKAAVFLVMEHFETDLR